MHAGNGTLLKKKKGEKRRQRRIGNEQGSGLIPQSIHILLLTRLPLLVNGLECNMLSLDPVCVDVSSMERFMCAESQTLPKALSFLTFNKGL